MLAVMSYNGYIFLTVVLSMGFGYFLFGHKIMALNMEIKTMEARNVSVRLPILPKDKYCVNCNGVCKDPNSHTTLLCENVL